MDQNTLGRMIAEAAQNMPPPSDVAPENDLHPSPATLRQMIVTQGMHIERLEKWASMMDPNFSKLIDGANDYGKRDGSG